MKLFYFLNYTRNIIRITVKGDKAYLTEVELSIWPIWHNEHSGIRPFHQIQHCILKLVKGKGIHLNYHSVTHINLRTARFDL